MNKIKLIQSVKQAWQSKYSYACQMNTYSESMKTYFMSERQYNNLLDQFGDSYYSTSQNPVYGVFDKQRFIWAGNKKDIPWLMERFDAALDELGGVIWSEREHRYIPVLEVPEEVEIADEFKD